MASNECVSLSHHRKVKKSELNHYKPRLSVLKFESLSQVWLLGEYILRHHFRVSFKNVMVSYTEVQCKTWVTNPSSIIVSALGRLTSFLEISPLL